MAVLTSFTTNTSAADAMDTLNKMLADIKALKDATIPAPSFTAQPSISGTPTVGQTLTGNSGTISNGSVSARQWLRDGVPISDATAVTYALVTADAGKALTFRVTATGSGGSTDATSQAVTVAAAPVATPFFGSSTQTFGDDSTAYFGKAA